MPISTTPSPERVTRNADEIVRALRDDCEDCPEFGKTDKKCHGLYYCPNRDAAALIERMQDQLLQNTQQLAASQARERAAVAEIYKIAACDACKHYDPDENDCAKPLADSHKCFEWRGPQEAGEREG